MRRNDMDLAMEVAVQQGNEVKKGQVLEFTKKGAKIHIDGKTHDLSLRVIMGSWQNYEEETKRQERREATHEAERLVRRLLAVRSYEDFPHPMRQYLGRRHDGRWFDHPFSMGAEATITLPLDAVVTLQQKEQRLGEMEALVEALKHKLVKVCVEFGIDKVTPILKLKG